MKLIFVASPYAGDIEMNTEFAKDACRHVMNEGHAFFAPHLLYPSILDDSKPEERRLLFEETAGITKYRNRKRESLRKLEDTEANLLRVTDIIQEIENQLEPLAEQAEKTRAYNVLQAEYKDCRLTQLLHKYEKSSREKTDGERRLKELRDEEIALQAQSQLMEARKEQLGKELLDVENSLKLLAEKNSELSGKLDHNNSEIAMHLNCSLATIKTHVQHIYQKININNRQELICKFLR